MWNWKYSIKNLGNLFLELRCGICQRSSCHEFCADCTKRLFDDRRSQPDEFWSDQKKVFVWGFYRGTLKRGLTRLKYNNQPDLAYPMGVWLGEAWLKFSTKNNGFKKLLVVPIPLHERKLRERGFNQAELLAEGFGAATGLQVVTRLLKRTRYTKPQFNLSAEERKDNLVGAFEIGSGFKGGYSILLLDDIYTTGSTIREVTALLDGAQMGVYGVVAMAMPLK